MSAFIDITGLRFTRLLVLERSQKRTRHGERLWRVRCDCGVEKEILGQGVRIGRIKSCGCLNRELTGARARKQQMTHGEGGYRYRTREYRSWEAAKRRCFNPKDPKFPAYGGRGIGMCAAWRDDYAQFLADMGRAPFGTTIDRRNNEGDYEPSNCRWATPKQQAQNRRPIKRCFVVQQAAFER